MSRATGPTAATIAAVDDRAGNCCERCGAWAEGGSRHHRKLRRHGDHSVQNLVLLCGSGTTGCHGFVHANPALSYADGWMIHGGDDPLLVPIPLHGRRPWATLNNEGQYDMMTSVQALARRRELGLIA